MRVVCTANHGSALSAKHFEKSGNTPFSEFDLKIGEEYVVYGIIVSKGLLSYLVIGTARFAQWYPADLFKVSQSKLPDNWHFVHFREDQGFLVEAIWGYEELTKPDHFDALSDMQPSAINIFIERKKEIDTVF